MDDRAAARRPNLELVKKSGEQQRTSSGVVPAGLVATTEGSPGIAMGAVLDGKYLVGRIVGAGAVGIVFEAQNLELDEKVAIKCLRPEMLVDTAMVARFAREAKAAAALKSEYVATVHDVGTTPEGVPYIVMEYLEGKDLGVVVQEHGTVSPRSAVEYTLQVCEALAVAHAKGIVHRDVKPENLLLTERAGGMKIVKVLDFGISKAALTGSIFRDELPLVKTVNLMGTPLYMSPEQVRCSDSVDVRSDIWSLGMVLYEILTGNTAFVGQSITEICASILEAQPKPIELHRNDLPSGLVEVISKCLEKDVNRRYQTVAELALALMPFGPKRSRLNVERAVAVLQSAGQLDPKVTVDSTIPPATSESQLLSSTALKAPSVPGGLDSGVMASGHPSGAVPARVSGAVPAPVVTQPDLDSHEVPDFHGSRRTPRIIAAVVAVLALGGIVTILVTQAAPKSGSAPDPNAGKAAAPVVTTVAAPLPATGEPVNAPTVRHEASGSGAPAATEAATAAKTVGWAPPRPGARPLPGPHTPPAATAPSITPPKGTTTASATGAPAAPSAAAKSDEPDLGY